MPRTPTQLPARRESGGSLPIGFRRPYDSPFAAMERLMDEMMGSFGLTYPGTRATGDTDVFPPVDLCEDTEGYYVTAELPGLRREDVQLSYINGALTLSGEKKDERVEKESNYYACERSFGNFRRSFRIPGEVMGDKIQASFKDGVLTVMLPKTRDAQSQEKKIEIKG